MLFSSIIKNCETNFREDKAVVKTGLFNGIMVPFRKVSIKIHIVFIFLQNIQYKYFYNYKVIYLYVIYYTQVIDINTCWKLVQTETWAGLGEQSRTWACSAISKFSPAGSFPLSWAWGSNTSFSLNAWAALCAGAETLSAPPFRHSISISAPVTHSHLQHSSSSPLSFTAIRGSNREHLRTWKHQGLFSCLLYMYFLGNVCLLLLSLGFICKLSSEAHKWFNLGSTKLKWYYWEIKRPFHSEEDQCLS